MKRRNRRIFIAAAAILAFSIAIRVAAQASSSFAEEVLVPAGAMILMPIKLMISVLPFSVSEASLYLFLPAMASLFIVLHRRAKQGRKLHILPAFSLTVSILYMMYNLALGCPTFRRNLTETLGWKGELITKAELISATETFAKKASEEREASGGENLTYSDENNALTEAYFKAERQYGFRYFIPATPKRVLASKLLSYTQTAGIYIPFFTEPNVNIDQPRFAYAFTAAHEMAHSVLIAREMDANMVAFLVCIGSDKSEVRYSGYFFALLYSIDALADTDLGEARRIFSTLSPQVKQDYQAYSDNVQKYEGKVADISQSINNEYIKATGQPAGIQSYGDVVDLLILWNRNIMHK